MGAIYCGLAVGASYVFATNDTFGSCADECAIAEVNRFCGALIVTRRGNTLIGVKKIFAEGQSCFASAGEGISRDLVEAIIGQFLAEFSRDSAYKENPLPFLLLLVGHNPHRPHILEWIAVRNRVVKVDRLNDRRVYTTAFDIQAAAPAGDLFYGHSEISQYLSLLVPQQDRDLELTKLLACYCLTQTKRLDDSIYPGMSMATLLPNRGFEWISREELQEFSRMSDAAGELIAHGIGSFFAAAVAQPLTSA